jgi:hypothetical protein
MPYKNVGVSFQNSNIVGYLEYYMGQKGFIVEKKSPQERHLILDN